MKIDDLTFNQDGLIPAIVQDASSKEVLTLAYMNAESLQKTMDSRETWFFSRSRQELWHKGETSGNTQRVLDIRVDCDADALIVEVDPKGPACHKGTYSCFNSSLLADKRNEFQKQGRFQILNELESIISAREADRPKGAYTTYLFNEGVDKILKKVGEESAEVIIAAKNRSFEELTQESADLIYHLLVLLREQRVGLDAVLNVLKERHSITD